MPCNEEKFDTGPPDSDKFVQIQQKPNMGSLPKTRFFSKQLFFFRWTYTHTHIYIYIYPLLQVELHNQVGLHMFDMA